MYRTLSNALQKDRLAHAYLFSGPKGSPKKKLRYYWHKVLLVPIGMRMGLPAKLVIVVNELRMKNPLIFLETRN